jgi:hypothetical protein
MLLSTNGSSVRLVPDEAEAQALEVAALDRVANLRIHQRFCTHVVELQRRIESGHLTDEVIAVPVAHARRETIPLVVQRRIDDFVDRPGTGVSTSLILTEESFFAPLTMKPKPLSASENSENGIEAVISYPCISHRSRWI